MLCPTRRTALAAVAALCAAAAVAAAVLPAHVVGVSNGSARATAAQAGSNSLGDWLQSTATSTPLDTRSFVEIMGSATQTGASGAPHAVTVRAVARIVPKAGSARSGTIDVICELVERPAGNVIDRVEVTADPHNRRTLLNTAVAILPPRGSVKWRCRQQRTSTTHLVRLEHGRLIDVVVGNGSKLGPDIG